MKQLPLQRMFLPPEPRLCVDSRFLSHLPPGLEYCGTNKTEIKRCTVIISLDLSLERSDGQGSCGARLGARESVGNPRGSFVTTIDQGFRG